MSDIHPHHPMKPFVIPNHWTPEQAMAVVDLLDELRTRIWSMYQVPLLDSYREELKPRPGTDARATLFADGEPI
jgi:hypothetical protein